jgi:hypothetical protein
MKEIQKRSSKIQKEVLHLLEANTDCRVLTFADSNKFNKDKLTRTCQIVLFDKVKFYEFYNEKYVKDGRYVHDYENDYYYLNSEIIKSNVDVINEFLNTLKYDNIELEMKILENKKCKFPKTTHEEYIQLSIKTNFEERK